jgi:hypothetical protein
MKAVVLWVSVLCAVVVAQDTDPPYVDGMDPGDGDFNVPPDADIVFHCKDDGVGVDVDTISFSLYEHYRGDDQVTDASPFYGVVYQTAYGIPGELDIDDTDINDVVCTFDPDDDLAKELYQCFVSGNLADLNGNRMDGSFIWHFIVGGVDDFDPPYVDGMDPGEDGYGPSKGNIVFHCKDDGVGVDCYTIDFRVWEDWPWLDRSMTVDAVGFLERTPKVISAVPGDLDIDDTDPNDVVCTFDPDYDFHECDTITCVVSAGLGDILENVMEDDFVWEFSVDVVEMSWGEVKAREW